MLTEKQVLANMAADKGFDITKGGVAGDTQWVGYRKGRRTVVVSYVRPTGTVTQVEAFGGGRMPKTLRRTAQAHPAHVQHWAAPVFD